MSKHIKNQQSKSRNGQTNSHRLQTGNLNQPVQKKLRSLWRNGLIPLGLVVVLLVVFLAVKVTSSPVSATKSAASNGETPLAASVAQAVTTVPDATLNAIGAPSELTAPSTVTGNTKTLVSNGKPSIVYMGAEYCPYCAAERWALVVALSRFGTFKNLGATHSSSSDVYPNTATLSFYGSSYSSKYLTFTPVELQTNQVSGSFYKTLQTPTAQEQSLFNKFDVPPYTTSAGGTPFIDFGNRFIQSGASYNPQLLQGKTTNEIANALHDPSTDIAMGVDGTANMLSAAICKLTNGQPGSVCSSSAVSQAIQKLG